MKFGQNLPRNQVPEWAATYINYKALKKLIKRSLQSAQDQGDADVAEFFYALDRNLEDVDSFYNKKYAEYARRLKLLYDRYGQAAHMPEGMDKEEMEDLMGALLELRSQYRKLQWYGEVNRRGFIKITKKLDKKVLTSRHQSRYLATKVDPKPFATNFRLTNDMRAINEWLSTLGDVKTFDDASSIQSTGSLHRVSSKSALSVSTPVLDGLDLAIRQDDTRRLSELIDNSTTNLIQAAKTKLLLSLLQRAISCRSYQSITLFLDRLETLEDDEDMNKRNCIHRLIIAIGRSRALEAQNDSPSAPVVPESTPFIAAAELPVRIPLTFKVEERDATKTLGSQDPMVKLLAHILGHMTPNQRSALAARDTYGRFPLHYSAQYGLVAVSQELILYMKAWTQFDASAGIDTKAWQDIEGYAPLHLSVIGGHYRTTQALLLAENDETVLGREDVAKSGAVLALATKANFYKIVKLLVEAGVNVNHQDEQGETALHVCARFGFEKCAKALLDGSATQRPDLEIREKTFGWTPLFIASVDGQLPVVEHLLAAGALTDRVDFSGWKPIEHAALRGHLDIVDILAPHHPPGSLATPHHRPTNSSSDSPPKGSSLDERRSAATSNGRLPEPVKTFGHRYLSGESMVLVSLGSMDLRKALPAVVLESIPLADAHATQLDTALTLVISATGATGEPSYIDLPVHENISTSPITFTTKDPSKVKVLFDIVPTYAGSKDKIVGRGVALLSSIKPSLGSKRITLHGDLSVPVVAAETLDVIGKVNFNFLIITPFSHPNMTITENQTYWKRTSTMVIGHRGLGRNQASMKSLQLGENTIQSFIAAANLGASYVEFDVQLTKDLVPVIYHDFLVSETGIDAPVHTLTLEQFLHAGEGQQSRPSRPSSPTRGNGHTGRRNLAGRAQRSYSAGAPDEEFRPDMGERMKHTRDFKRDGFKPNSRGNFIQAPFTTLEEMFRTLPESVGFNIEMKYPMLFESENEGMDTYAVEINSFVDNVLTMIYDLGKGRNVIVSSFHPDICLLLSFKQPSIPVLFLTDAGISPVGDIRASSLQEAIRFASRWNLLGVVSAAQPLVSCPRLVRVVKESGLVCVSYGGLNNDTANVKIQVQEGIDAVIVDSVLAIRKGLTAAESAAAVTPAHTDGAHTNGAHQNGDALKDVAKVANTIDGLPFEKGSVRAVY